MATSSSCSMASASSRIVVTRSVTSNITSTIRGSMLFFSNKKNANSRLVVRAEEAAAPTASPKGEAAAAPAAQPPPIGPKRGAKVRILRRESHWYKGIGSVVAVDQDPKTRYPVVVRFNKVNYANVSTNSYALDEIEVIE